MRAAAFRTGGGCFPADQRLKQRNRLQPQYPGMTQPNDFMGLTSLSSETRRGTEPTAAPPNAHGPLVPFRRMLDRRSGRRRGRPGWGVWGLETDRARRHRDSARTS